MPAPLGNRNAVGAGRPASLARQLTVADQAASRVARLMERPGSISRSAADLAERFRSGEDELPFISTAGLRKLEDDALEAEIARRLVEKSRSLLLLLGNQAGAETAATLLADVEEGAAIAARVAGSSDAGAEPARLKIHADEWSQWVATAAATLDRAIDEEAPQ